MQASVWGMHSLLIEAGDEIDAAPFDSKAAQIRALQVRHLIDQMGTEILQRFSRAYGPYPLSMNEETSRRYHEAGLYMRQSHAERDLECLGRLIRIRKKSNLSDDNRADCESRPRDQPSCSCATWREGAASASSSLRFSAE
jgi:hypothetical protein